MTNYGKLLERWEYQTVVPVSWETCIQVSEQQLEPSMEKLTGSRSRKEYDRAICCHCLLNLYSEHIMRNARLDELWAGIRIGGRYVDDTTLMAQSEEKLKNILMRVKEESERASLRLNIKKLRSFHLRKRWKQWQISSSWAPKWLQTVTVAMKSEENWFLAGKWWQT